jgi:hypothetical protein
MNTVKSYVDEILRIGLLEKKATVFLIGNTSKIIKDDFYSIPVRIYDQFATAGVVVSSEKIARSIAKSVDGLVEYIFVDSEKKILDINSVSTTPGNIQRAVSEVVTSSILISYKANDLTVDAADLFISEYFSNDVANLGGKKTAIIGSGNIGSKIAAKLVERGSNVSMYRRKTNVLNRVVEYINDSKPKYTIATASAAKSITEACNQADILIGLTNGIAVIHEKEISCTSSNPLIIDVGKGSISKNAVKFAHSQNIEVYRLSIESAMEGMITSSISTNNVFRKKTGRRLCHGINIVSGGVLALKNEFVVDNYLSPKIVYGLGNGEGDFERSLTVEMQNKLKDLKEIIRKEQ